MVISGNKMKGRGGKIYFDSFDVFLLVVCSAVQLYFEWSGFIVGVLAFCSVGSGLVESWTTLGLQ